MAEAMIVLKTTLLLLTTLGLFVATLRQGRDQS